MLLYMCINKYNSKRLLNSFVIPEHLTNKSTQCRPEI